ncbi:MAG: hypothetical protein AAF682_06330 [Planctomycetota bacterium]
MSTPEPSPHFSPREALSLFTPIAPGRTESLRALLDELGQDVEHMDGFPLHELPEVHFVRLFVVEGDAYGEIPDRLVYSANIDGSWRAHLSSLVARAPLLREIYGHCEGFPAAADGEGSQRLFEWLAEHRVKPRLFYQGTTGRTTAQITGEAALHDELAGFFDEGLRVGRWGEASPTRIVADAREHVRAQAGRLPQGPPPTRSAEQRTVHGLDLARRVLIFATPFALLTAASLLLLDRLLELSVEALWAPLGLLAVTALVVGVTFLIVRFRETSRLPSEEVFPPATRLDFSNAALVAQQEDHQIQNQISLSIPIKPSRFRRTLVRIVLWVGDGLVRFVFTRGSLFGIRSIHFARFHVDERRDSVLFFSNYDASWESYLEDFLTEGKRAVVPIWTNLRWCPRTRWLFHPAVGFAAIFKPYIRHHQMRTSIWYSAYRDLTAANINNNTAIRRGLWSVRSEGEALEWLKLFSK